VAGVAGAVGEAVLSPVLLELTHVQGSNSIFVLTYSNIVNPLMIVDIQPVKDFLSLILYNYP